jgi:2-oxoglutarate ferredoxin oxidoreductase subunit alpha
VEINYSDNPNGPLINDETRRYAQLAWLLRAHTLMDVDCWSVVYGRPLQPRMILDELLQRLEAMNAKGGN